MLGLNLIHISKRGPWQDSCVILNQYTYIMDRWIHSLAYERGCNLKLSIIVKLISQPGILNISCEIALRWMPQALTDEFSQYWFW